MLIAALSGALTWSLLEYLIHRFAGHDRRLARRTPFGIEHTAHHSRGDYFAPWWKKLIVLLLFVALVLPLAALGLGGALGAAYTVGLVGFYAVPGCCTGCSTSGRASDRTRAGRAAITFIITSTTRAAITALRARSGTSSSAPGGARAGSRSRPSSRCAGCATLLPAPCTRTSLATTRSARADVTERSHREIHTKK